MNQEILKKKLITSINCLIKNDSFLLQYNASERAIAHRLALYLEEQFEGYDVDCEYNLNLEDPSNRKQIPRLEERVKECHKEIDQDLADPFKREEEHRNVYVLPDIIIHLRGVNTHNLLIIEIKKSSSPVAFKDYDEFKLKQYTLQSLDRGLKYNYGGFIEFKIGDVQGNPYEFSLYCNGEKLDL